MKEYYDFLKEEIMNFEGNFPKYILYIPDFFKLLCKLTEKNISINIKRNINSALAYFVIPNDAIPEDIYGPAGYIDDIYVCCYVINEIKTKLGLSMLKDLWEGEEEFEYVLKVSYEKSKKELEEKNLIKTVMKISCLGCNNE